MFFKRKSNLEKLMTACSWSLSYDLDVLGFSAFSLDKFSFSLSAVHRTVINLFPQSIQTLCGNLSHTASCLRLGAVMGVCTSLCTLVSARACHCLVEAGWSMLFFAFPLLPPACIYSYHGNQSCPFPLCWVSQCSWTLLIRPQSLVGISDPLTVYRWNRHNNHLTQKQDDF